jgi:hypothetical protein
VEKRNMPDANRGDKVKDNHTTPKKKKMGAVVWGIIGTYGTVMVRYVIFTHG